MTRMPPFATVTAAIATAFGADFSVDFSRMAHHAHWLLDNGCNGLVLFGTTGEAASLTLPERRQILERLIGAGVPARSLLVGTGCCALADTVDLTLHAARAGAAGALVLPPYFFKGVSDTGVAQYFDALIDACGDGTPPLYLYNIPQVTGAPVTLALTEYLIRQHGSIIRGYKDSSGNWDNTAAVIRRFPTLDVYIGSEGRLLDHLGAGGVGCISASVNVQPESVRALYDNWRAPSAAATQQQIVARRKTLESGALIPNVKATLATIHSDDGWARLRPPLETPGVDVRAMLTTQLRSQGLALR